MQSGRTDPQEIRNDQATIFQKNQILSLLWRIGNQEQARTVVDHFASSAMSTRRHLWLWSRQNSRLGKLGPISYRIGMPNGTGNFRNFQISRKKDNLGKLTEIFEMNFRKFSVPFDSEPEFSEILVELNAPLVPRGSYSRS